MEKRQRPRFIYTKILKEEQKKVKSVFYSFCLASVVVSGPVFYFALQRAPVVNTIRFPLTTPHPSSTPTSTAEQKVKTPNKKECACCREKLTQSRKVTEQRIQARKAWAREMFVNYGYEEGMKRIAAKDPGLAKQIQQTLEREKQPNLTSAVAQSSSQ